MNLKIKKVIKDIKGNHFIIFRNKIIYINIIKNNNKINIYNKNIYLS